MFIENETKRRKRQEKQLGTPNKVVNNVEEMGQTNHTILCFVRKISKSLVN